MISWHGGSVNRWVTLIFVEPAAQGVQTGIGEAGAGRVPEKGRQEASGVCCSPRLQSGGERLIQLLDDKTKPL